MWLVEVQHNATGDSHKEAGDSNRIGAHAQFLEQLGPQEAEGTVKMQVEPFLGI